MSSRTLREEAVFRTPWFTLMARWLKPEGSAPYYAIRTTDYVSVVARTSQGAYILVRQYRAAVGGLTLELPSGTVDPGMTPRRTAVQELLEETGYRPGRLLAAGSLRPDTGRMMNRLWVFYAENCERVAGARTEKGISTLLVPAARMDRLVRSGKFDHALNVAALAVAQRKFKF
jgi:8-oxo-dGTP pyrophosphatase MutT (NUDIX family)